MAHILIINGHPDPSEKRFCAALAAAYAKGARAQEDHVRRIDIGELDFPILRDAEDYEHGTAPPAIAEAQKQVGWADHLVIVFPLWQGGLPALAKAFFEQLFRPEFAMRWRKDALPQGLLEGTSVRLIVTMGMPALAFRLFFGAFGVRAFEQSVLRLVGLHLSGRTMIGDVGGLTKARAGRWLAKVEDLAGEDI